MTEIVNPSLSLLLVSAGSLAVFHTVIGIDHAIPFVVLGRARRWTLARTLWITSLCGAGHVASSIVIGGIGVALGVALDSLTWVEQARGDVAAAVLIGFGLAYAAWAYWRGLRSRPHTHVHAHADGTVHDHTHDHQSEHLHPHGEARGLTPWVLFVIFLLGPCEPLIPLMMVPAMHHAWFQLIALVTVFAVGTILTMIGVVTVGFVGLKLDRLRPIEQHVDVVAGLTIAASGVAVMWLGI
jgi:sulfite exporter TauE/SafE